MKLHRNCVMFISTFLLPVGFMLAPIGCFMSSCDKTSRGRTNAPTPVPSLLESGEAPAPKSSEATPASLLGQLPAGAAFYLMVRPDALKSTLGKLPVTQRKLFEAVVGKAIGILNAPELDKRKPIYLASRAFDPTGAKALVDEVVAMLIAKRPFREVARKVVAERNHLTRWTRIIATLMPTSKGAAMVSALAQALLRNPQAPEACGERNCKGPGSGYGWRVNSSSAWRDGSASHVMLVKRDGARIVVDWMTTHTRILPPPAQEIGLKQLTPKEKVPPWGCHHEHSCDRRRHDQALMAESARAVATPPHAMVLGGPSGTCANIDKTALFWGCMRAKDAMVDTGFTARAALVASLMGIGSLLPEDLALLFQRCARTSPASPHRCAKTEIDPEARPARRLETVTAAAKHPVDFIRATMHDNKSRIEWGLGNASAGAFAKALPKPITVNSLDELKRLVFKPLNGTLGEASPLFNLKMSPLLKRYPMLLLTTWPDALTGGVLDSFFADLEKKHPGISLGKQTISMDGTVFRVSSP